MSDVLSNPFKRIKAYQIPETVENSWLYNLVLAGARGQGLKSVLQLLPLNESRRMRTSLKKYRVKMFDADRLWDQLPSALSVLEQLKPRERSSDKRTTRRQGVAAARLLARERKVA